MWPARSELERLTSKLGFKLNICAEYFIACLLASQPDC